MILITPCVLAQIAKYIVFMKGHNYMRQVHLLFLSVQLSQKNLKVLSMVTKIYIFFEVTPYI